MNFIRKHINSFSIIIFLLSFYILNLSKPGFLYNNDGTIREFGLGQKRNLKWLPKKVIRKWLRPSCPSIHDYSFGIHT